MSLKDLSGRLARWSLKLQAFVFLIEHRKGSENVMADMPSRVVDEMDELPDVTVVNGFIFKRTQTRNGGSHAEEISWKL